MTAVFTIGHGTRTTDELCSLLKANGVELLIDVRRFPGSRKHPHFSRDSLEEQLPGYGLVYEWWGEELGGRRSNSGPTKHPAWRHAAFQAYADHMDEASFRSSFLTLEKRASGTPLAVMCSETLWWRCHRRLIADVLTVREHSVQHIMGTDKLQTHPLNPLARPTPDGWIVYDGVESTPEQ